MHEWYFIQWFVNASALDDDPLYTESNWPADIGANIFIRDSHEHNLTIFGLGLFVTVLTILLSWLASRFLNKQLGSSNL